MSVSDIQKALRLASSDNYKFQLQKYFKTGVGEYAEGDLFLGVRVPIQHKIAKQFKTISIHECFELLKSHWHEERYVALDILYYHFIKGSESDQESIVNAYLSHLKFVNHWDLVDYSAHRILGTYLFNRNKDILYTLAHSKNLWERRISIIACYYFIKKYSFADAINISELLLHDPHDLIHKAVGWMLREVGNRDKQAEFQFLKTHYQKMPRTMLRYAIEKFPSEERKRWLQGRI